MAEDGLMKHAPVLLDETVMRALARARHVIITHTATTVDAVVAYVEVSMR